MCLADYLRDSLVEHVLLFTCFTIKKVNAKSLESILIKMDIFKMITTEKIDCARQKLEAILNGEVYATEYYRMYEIRRLIVEQTLENETNFYKPKKCSLKKRLLRRKRKELQKRHDPMYVRTRANFVVGMGTRQIVIDLGSGIVAKIRYTIKNDRLVSVDRSYPYMKETIETLVSLGMEVPEMWFYHTCWEHNKVIVSSDVYHSSYLSGSRYALSQSTDPTLNKRKDLVEYSLNEIKLMEKSPNICLTADLRENGRYAVVDYNKEQARILPNYRLIADSFKEILSKLLDVYKKGFPRMEQLKDCMEQFLIIDPHDFDRDANGEYIEETPEETIRKMFLLQIPVNTNEEGKLVVGDIDHIYAFR